MDQGRSRDNKINRNFWDWRPYFYDSILEQGRRMEMDGLLTSVSFSQNGRWARAKTRDGCSVEITKAPTTYAECAKYEPWKNDIGSRRLLRRFSADDRYKCSCRSQQNGMLCSHLAALLFRWEKVRGPFIFTETEEERVQREQKDDIERKAQEKKIKLNTPVSVLSFIKDQGRTVSPKLCFRPDRIFADCYTNEYFADLALELIKSQDPVRTDITTCYDRMGRQLLSAKAVAGSGNVPRFGKAYRLDESYDAVTYTGRAGESYCDMKEQFPIEQVSCTVADMTEPNIKPQESGNRCDCTAASFSDGNTAVTFRAVDKPFELGVKPYTDRALFSMKHREDEKRTGTYVTIQAFQQGIGTGACGPGIMPEFQFPAKQDYELKFLISVSKGEGEV